MNPLLVIGGLAALGFALMGLKKKPTYSSFRPFEPDVTPIPEWIRKQEEADDGMYRYNIPGRVA